MIMHRQVLFYLQTWETQSKPNQENKKNEKHSENSRDGVLLKSKYLFCCGDNSSMTPNL